MNRRDEERLRYRQRIAGSSPSSLLRSPFFWGEQRAFLTIVAVGVFMLIRLAPYTYSSANGWDYMVIVVQSLAFWGAAIAAQSLATLEIEQAIVREIETRGADYIRDVKGGNRPRINLDQLEQAMLPKNPSNPQPAMIRLFQHICKEAKDRKFESSVNVMQPYREEPLEDIFKLQNLQKVALWLGILGTFIGLLIAMKSADLNEMLKSNALLEVVHKMFGGLIISFSASLAGLQVAVVLGVFLLLLRKRQERYFKAMESAVVTMLSLARNAVNKDDFLAEFSQISGAVTALTDRVTAQSEELAGTQRVISAQSEEIRNGMAKLQTAGSEFNGFLNQIGEAQNEFIGEIKGIYDTISLKNLAVTVQGSVAHAGQLLSDKLFIATTQISNRLEDFNAAVTKLSGALDAEAQHSAEAAKKLAAQINASSAETTAAIKGIVRQLQEIVTRESGSAVRHEMQDLSRRIAELSNVIGRVEYLAPPRRSLRQFITSWRW